MRRLFRYTITATLFLLLCGNPVAAWAQSSSEVESIGTSMANFLKVGVGARAMGMGNAFVAMSDDASGLYWNPGGIPRAEKNQILVQQSNWIVDTKMIYLGVIQHLSPFSSMGVSVNYFGSGDIEETTLEKPDGTGRTFDASDLAVGLTYAAQVTDRFSTGVTLKWIQEKIASETGSTVAFDIGSVFVTNFFNDMRIGMSLQNLGGRMKLTGSDLAFQYQSDPDASTKVVQSQLDTDSWDIPLLFRFGVATEIMERDEFYRWTVSFEIMDSRDFIHRLNVGTEIAFYEYYYLRGGWKFNYDEENFTVGAGARFDLSGSKLQLGYAYQNFGLLENAQFFTFVFEF